MVSRLAKAGNNLIHASATNTVPTPPKTTEPMGPIAAAVAPDSNSPSSFEAPMNTPLTAATRPRISSGVSSCIKVKRMTTLMLSAAPATANSKMESPRWVDSPKPMLAKTKHSHSRQQFVAYPFFDGPAGHDEGHQQSTHRWCRPQITQFLRAAMQDVFGKNRQQRRCAAQQNRKQVQRNCPQQHLTLQHKSQSCKQ